MLSQTGRGEVPPLALAPAVDVSSLTGARITPDHIIFALDAHRHPLHLEFQFHFTNLPGLLSPTTC